MQWQKRSAGASVEHRMLYDATRTVAAMGMPYIEFVRVRSERGRRATLERGSRAAARPATMPTEGSARRLAHAACFVLVASVLTYCLLGLFRYAGGIHPRRRCGGQCARVRTDGPCVQERVSMREWPRRGDCDGAARPG